MTVGDFPEPSADADERRAVLAVCVESALGTLAGRAAATVDEVAELFGIGRSTAYEAVRRGDIPSLQLGGRRIVVPVPALAALLLGLEANGVGAVQANGGADLAADPVSKSSGRHADAESA
jgi:excisionase family DNA binding protein